MKMRKGKEREMKGKALYEYTFHSFPSSSLFLGISSFFLSFLYSGLFLCLFYPALPSTIFLLPLFLYVSFLYKLLRPFPYCHRSFLPLDVTPSLVTIFSFRLSPCPFFLPCSFYSFTHSVFLYTSKLLSAFLLSLFPFILPAAFMLLPHSSHSSFHIRDFPFSSVSASFQSSFPLRYYFRIRLIFLNIPSLFFLPFAVSFSFSHSLTHAHVPLSFTYLSFFSFPIASISLHSSHPFT